MKGINLKTVKYSIIYTCALSLFLIASILYELDSLYIQQLPQDERRAKTYQRFYRKTARKGLVENQIANTFDLNRTIIIDKTEFDFVPTSTGAVIPYFPANQENVNIDPRWSFPVRGRQKFDEAVLNLLGNFTQFGRTAKVRAWISNGLLLSLVVEHGISDWDFKYDFQVSAKDFSQLITLNQTVFGGRYLLDISPNALLDDYYSTFEEARFIDLTNGLFLNIWQVLYFKLMYITRNDLMFDFNDLVPLEGIKFASILSYRPHNAINILGRAYMSD